MAQEKAFRNMNELITALAKAERELAGGTLGVDGLETACADARELYERLIVLRHKAREAAVASPAPAVAPARTQSGVEGPAPAPAPASSKPAPTLAEKLEQAAIPDLAKAISLSHKFWFVAELFNGDRITYDKSIDRLNTMPDGAAAQAFVQAEVIDKLRKPADPEALATFTELVKRRYA